MGSEWAKEANRQAEAITRDLAEACKAQGLRVIYQKREARFALKTNTTTAYFAAHDYETRKGMDWQQLRKDLLVHVRQMNNHDEGETGRKATPP